MTVWVPRWSALPDAASDAVEGIAGWLRSPALWRLVSEWDAEAPPGADVASLLAWLDDFSARHWDFRRGRERNLAEIAELSPRQQEAALALTPELGLAASHPAREHYDAIVMTGGMVRAGIVKPRFVRGLLDGGVTAGRVVFLGAHRHFAGDEARLAAALGVHGSDEVEAMAEGMERAFDASGVRWASTGEGHARASVARWQEPSHPLLEVVAAPSSEPEVRRAHTADTFHHWASSVTGAVGSVLVVTTPIYVPYQAAVAVESLGIDHGLAVETVGVDAAANDLGEHTQPYLPQHHLQELRSAIRGIRSLHDRLQESSIWRSGGM